MNTLFSLLITPWVMGLGLAIIVGHGQTYVDGTVGTIREIVRLMISAVVAVLAGLTSFLWSRVRRW